MQVAPGFGGGTQDPSPLISAASPWPQRLLSGPSSIGEEFLTLSPGFPQAGWGTEVRKERKKRKRESKKINTRSRETQDSKERRVERK